MATTQFPVTSTATTDWLTPAEMRTLEAVCEALLPPTPPPAGENDADGYYARSASDLGVATLMAALFVAGLGTSGTLIPAIAPTTRVQAPAVSMTAGVSMVPCGVTTVST